MQVPLAGAPAALLQAWQSVVPPAHAVSQQTPARVHSLFDAAVAGRGLDPAWVKLVLSESVEVARTRDAGPFHLVELHPDTAAGPATLLRALFTHELAHVAHRDPLVKRALCGALVPLCTLVAALSAGLIEGRSDGAEPLAIAMALLAAATLLPWAYASLQALSFAMELRADREAAQRCGAGRSRLCQTCSRGRRSPRRTRRRGGTRRDCVMLGPAESRCPRVE